MKNILKKTSLIRSDKWVLFGSILLFLSLVFGLFIRIVGVVQFSILTGDQIRDAYATMEIWQGKFPTLGPHSAWKFLWGDFVYLPPLYFYLVFPFTILSSQLSIQAFPNAFFTFLSIPLLVAVIYQLLEGIEISKRFFIASLIGFWYSVLVRNMGMNSGESLAGNPGSIPFFILLFIWLYNYQLSQPKNYVNSVLSWIGYGIVLAILVSLHFSALFVMPVVFIISCIYWFFKNNRNPKCLVLCLYAVLSSIITLLPYWIGEVQRNWINTIGIISLVRNVSSDEEYSLNLWERVITIIKSYFSLGNDIYFMADSRRLLMFSILSVTFMSIILLVGLLKFRGNKNIYLIVLATSILFFLAYSSADQEKTYNPVFYKLLIYCLPLFLTAASIAYLNISKPLEKIILIIIVLPLCFSIFNNLRLSINYINSHIGKNQILATNTIAEVLDTLPENSTFCHPQGLSKNLRLYQYTDQYVTAKNLKFSDNCTAGDYYMSSKFGLNPSTFKVYSSKKKKKTVNDKTMTIIKEDSTYYLYQIN